MDPSHTVLVHLKLEKESFEEYFCTDKITAGISMLNFFKLIKTMTNNDTLTLYIERADENKLGIRIENGEKNSITTYKLNLMDLMKKIFLFHLLHLNQLLHFHHQISKRFVEICLIYQQQLRLKV